MKNQYFGDINDFYKYSLLRILQGPDQFRLAVCWMLTLDDGKMDGSKIKYLESPPKSIGYDQELFDFLRNGLKTNPKRAVQLIHNTLILPRTSYYDEFLLDDIASRKNYIEQIKRPFNEVDLVFFDPDNGVEVKSVPKGRKGSSKYIYWDELGEVFRSGKSILVYQHFRREKRGILIGKMVSEFKEYLGVEKVFWFRTPHVVFFLAAQSQHSGYFTENIRLAMGKWGGKNILTKIFPGVG